MSEIGEKLNRNKCLQRHILNLRKVHTNLLSENKQLESELDDLLLNNKTDLQQIQKLSNKIRLNKTLIKLQSEQLKIWKKENADFHRSNHSDILSRKKRLLKKKHKRNSETMKTQRKLQKTINQNKNQLNPKTSSLSHEEQLKLAARQHELKKQLRDHDWSC